MKKYFVLICDDNTALRDSLSDYLTFDGFRVATASDGESALELLQRQHVDLVVLDIMLPGMSGLDVCREIRKTDSVPIIMLSAKGSEIDRIVGLELGADDYVAKPFSPREITIRIRRILQRQYGSRERSVLSLAELTVYPVGNKAVIKEEAVEMTTKECKVLAFLVEHVGKVVTREELLNTAWGYDYYGDTRVVDTLVKRIRKKIMLEGVHFKIRSVYGVGYKIEETP